MRERAKRVNERMRERERERWRSEREREREREKERVESIIDGERSNKVMIFNFTL